MIEQEATNNTDWTLIISLFLNLASAFKIIWDIRNATKTTNATTNSIDTTSMKLSDAMLKEWMRDADKAIRSVLLAERRILKFKLALEESIDRIKDCQPDGWQEFVERAEILLSRDDADFLKQEILHESK